MNAIVSLHLNSASSQTTSGRTPGLHPGIQSLLALLAAVGVAWLAPSVALAQAAAENPPAPPQAPEAPAPPNVPAAVPAPPQFARPAQPPRVSMNVSSESRPQTTFSERLQHILNRASSGGSSAPNTLVILTSGVEAKDQANLQEDLAIMSHILDKAIDDNFGSEQRTRKALGVQLSFPEVGPLRNSYLEGYGALFLLQVNFPLLPPPAKTEAQKDEPAASSTWEEARQEVFGPPGEAGPNAVPVEPYSEEKVNRLKTALTEALKNAANIRHLKSDEGVTICVLGGSKPGAGQVNVVRGSSTGGRGTATVVQNGAAQRATVLTLRARKSDIDALAKGQVSLDDFRQKATSATYEADTGAGGVMGFGYGAGGYGGGGARY